jgi:DNA-binding response OmpR family regulator
MDDRGTGGRGPSERATVLIVEDEPGLADLYAAWLADEYETETAYSGPAGLERVDDDVDVVILDRRMPELSGDEVLDRLRERGYGGTVAMVTGVDPDVDIVEMGFDDYLVKPVSQADLLELVERLVARERYSEDVRELFALASKRAALRARMPDERLEDSDEYSRLVEECRELKARVDEQVADLPDEEYEAMMGRLTRGTMTEG